MTYWLGQVGKGPKFYTPTTRYTQDLFIGLVQDAYRQANHLSADEASELQVKTKEVDAVPDGAEEIA